MEATQLIASEYGKSYTWELKQSLMGMKCLDLANKIIQQLHLPLTVAEYLQKTCEVQKKTFPLSQFMPGRKYFLNF